jgi:excinuclease ABC subunit C
MDVSRDEYMESINSIVSFLNGKGRELTDFLQGRMKDSAESLDFETATVYRDLLGAANSIIEKQRVVLLSGGDMDVVLAAKGEKGSHVVVFFLRDGRLSGRESHHLITNPEDEPKDMVSAFLKQYYINQSQIPKELLVEEALPDNALIEEWLSGLRGGSVRVFVPQKGDKKALLELARKDLRNVALLLEEKARSQREKDVSISSALMEIIKDVGATEASAVETETMDMADLAEGIDATEAGMAEKADILRIEAYDISNIQGVDSVGAMVVYMGNRPSRKDYRRFKIKTVDGADDYSSMQEVIYRRLKRWASGDAGFSPLPDIILLDGGRGHVNAISLVLKAMNLDIPVAGMVKDDKHRSRGLIYKGEEIDLKEKPVVYHFIGNVQEEVHRFAIEYHHGMRGKTMIRSELDGINGIGAKRRNALLTHFGSLDKIKTASIEELLEVQGMNRAAAMSIQEYFVKDSIEKGDIAGGHPTLKDK